MQVALDESHETIIPEPEETTAADDLTTDETVSYISKQKEEHICQDRKKTINTLRIVRISKRLLFLDQDHWSVWCDGLAAN